MRDSARMPGQPSPGGASWGLATAQYGLAGGVGEADGSTQCPTAEARDEPLVCAVNRQRGTSERAIEA